MRYAVITGAGQRVGRATAVELARQGFTVGIHYRSNKAGAEETLEACQVAGGDGWLIQGDLCDVSACQRIVAEVQARCEVLHVLVHNASMFVPGRFEDITLDQWEAMQAVHVRAPFLLTQGLLPQLRAAESTATGAEPGEGGLVVCLTDIGAERPLSGHAHYSVSKAGLLMLMRSLAVETAPAVRAIAVSPGQVAWPPDYPEDKRERIARRIPLGRVGTVEDIARLVRFVACEAPYLNGVVVDVDGGLNARYG